MKIGVIGTGNVGGTLGSRWAKGGHEVVFGSRRPESDEITDLLAESGPTARAASPAEAAFASEVIVLATPWPSTKEILEGLGDLTGKIVIDAVNPLLPGLAGLALGTNTSAGEQIASWIPPARVVKAFNTIGNNIMANPHFETDSSVLLYCGDDAEAKAVVHELAEELGFEPYDAGPLTQARVLEPFAMLWISMALKYGYSRNIGFKFLRR